MVLSLVKFFKQQELPLGVDLGPDTLKFLELIKDKSLYRLNPVCLPTPGSAVADGKLLRLQDLIEPLKELNERYSWKKKPVVTAIGGRQVVIRHLRLPFMTDSELGQAVVWEAEKYLSFVSQEYTIDYLNLGEVTGENGKQLLILFAAVPKEITVQYYELFEQTGFKLTAIDLIPLALKRSLVDFNYNESGKKAVLIFDLGSEISQLVIINQGKLSFSRTVAAGRSNVAAEVETAATAVELLDERNYPDVGSNREHLDYHQRQPDDGLPGRSLKNLVVELTREIRRSMDFYRTQSHGIMIEEILLSGEIKPESQIRKLLQEELNILVQIGKPGCGMNLDTLPQPDLAVAMGLALRGVRE